MEWTEFVFGRGSTRNPLGECLRRSPDFSAPVDTRFCLLPDLCPQMSDLKLRRLRHRCDGKPVPSRSSEANKQTFQICADFRRTSGITVFVSGFWRRYEKSTEQPTCGVDGLCVRYNYDSTSIRRPFDGHTTARQRSLRSEWRNPLAAVTLTCLFISAAVQQPKIRRRMVVARSSCSRIAVES